MRRRPTRPAACLTATLAAAALIAALAAPVRAADPDALWKIVHGRCVANQQAGHDPAPCVGIDAAKNAAVLKDIRGNTQFLLIPTARITGIEAPEILAANAPNYFAAAWAASPLVGARLHRTLPRQDLALAINSESGRSQNQLHIHIDCIDPDIRAALDRAMPSIGPRWRPLPMRLDHHRYRAIRVDDPDLSRTNPFRLLARSLADPPREMGRHTLVLVGVERHGMPGFVLLDGTAGLLSTTLTPVLKLGSGSGEELEDHACRIATPPPGATDQAEAHGSNPQPLGAQH